MKTKKFILPLAAVIVVLAIVLVACGAKATATTTAGGTTAGNSGGSGGFAANGTPAARNLTQPLPLAESLLIGTLKLQGTSNAITATQAAALVPLWQAYAQLTSSNTAAQAETDAVPYPRTGPGHYRHEADPPGCVYRNEQPGIDQWWWRKWHARF